LLGFFFKITQTKRACVQDCEKYSDFVKACSEMQGMKHRCNMLDFRIDRSSKLTRFHSFDDNDVNHLKIHSMPELFRCFGILGYIYHPILYYSSSYITLHLHFKIC
jgi:hypothetical protein